MKASLDFTFFLGDPYSAYRALRDRGPIHWSDDLFGGAWVLTTFDGVSGALKDPRLSAQRTGGWVMGESKRGSALRMRLVDMQRLFSRAMLFVDNPAHPRLRQAMQAGFQPLALRELQGFVEQTVAHLMDAIEARHSADEPFDFIETLAKLLPARVISHFLGFTRIDEAAFLSWSSRIATFLGSARPGVSEALDARSSIMLMSDYIEQCLDQGDMRPGGILARLVEAERRGDIEAGAEMLSQCAMLLFAGQETTRHFLGTAVYWLLQQPERWTEMRNPGLLRSAVRELLRWDSPVQYTGRRANCSFMLMGEQIRHNDLLLPLIGAANRDPVRYESPETIMLDRHVGTPLSFGTGPHVCIGASLTLLEAECALSALVNRWPRARLIADAARWIDQPLYRGLSNLMMYHGKAE